MGCGGSKVADAVESSGSSSPSGGGNAEDDIETVQGSDRVRTFRERRLSMSKTKSVKFDFSSVESVGIGSEPATGPQRAAPAGRH